MSKEQTTDLLKFLQPFGEEVIDLALWLREFVWDRYPMCNELIYDNYNALAFGWSPTERAGHVFCTIAIIRTNKAIHFGFYWGSQIEDPDKILIGNGVQYRYYVVKSKEDFPQRYMEKLLTDAYVNSLGKVKDPKQLVEGFTITKAVSPKKRELKVKVVKKK
ncbi:hypothetical protein IDJ77_23505 [Mucilaginibacter sp. ZT4R22]|uniref:YdhG-like domain-containing protein n=1 Tax=Mucilaginibacter pankratovii TaxID=2772110 RepID=A0ABR7WZV3_9SPHI|nr:hypothetical protein [Mucilaginibacter pankratovii]MBD1366797.1 hypothetical protein [Mucilaginibacter pankratovii]